MDNKEYIIGIDVGSSSVVMAAGVRNEGGEVSILGVEVQETGDCVKDGEINNYRELGNVIANAKRALEGELGRRINSAYVGISGNSVYCVRYEDYVDIGNKTGCVTENELRELNARIEMVTSSSGDEIIDRIPLRYRIDDSQDVKNPLGAFGRKLTATYLFVLASKNQIELVNRALHCAEIKASGLCVNPTLLPELILSPEEREDGVVIVDIGSDLTDVAIVREGKLWYFASLPIGASAINNDLYEFLKISKRDIDPLKKRYGSALAEGVPDNTTVPVKTAGHAKKQILQRNIAEIAEERLKDIAGFVMRELKAAKFSTRVPCGVVLTGGSAYLSNIDKLFARELQMEVRFARELNGLDEESQQNIVAFPQAVAVGLLLYGARHNACETSPEIVRPLSQPTPTPTPQPEPTVRDAGMFGGTTVVTPTPERDVARENVVEQKPIAEEKPQSEPEAVEPTEEQIEEKKTEEKIEHNEPKMEKSGWGTRFRNWLDEMFTDEYI